MAAGSSQASTANGAQFNDVRLSTYRILGDGTAVAMSATGAPWTAKNCTASGTTTVKSGAGQLFGFFCGTATGNITIYDNTAGSGTKILDTCALVAGLNQLPAAFGTGLTIVLSGAGVATALYN